MADNKGVVYRLVDVYVDRLNRLLLRESRLQQELDDVRREIDIIIEKTGI